LAENESDLFVSHQTGTSLLLISDVKDVFERFPQSVHHIWAGLRYCGHFGSRGFHVQLFTYFFVSHLSYSIKASFC